uniref:adenosine deaminase-like n=1 Tax=Styela clava TaxID=7725 RepID=UPI001939DED5|nr:adenosine deaminase-like [Styela clava]
MCENMKRYNFSKVELHCHLDGCFRTGTILELARNRNIKLPTYDEKEIQQYINVKKRCSLKECLSQFFNFLPTFAGDADAISRIAKEAVEDRAKDGVTYVELRYSPHILANCDVDPLLFAKERGRLRPKDVVEVINKAVRESGEKHQIKVRTILCTIAEYSHWGIETAHLCQEYANEGTVGFDVADIEGMENHLKDNMEIFQFCKKNGIHTTVHAGEGGPAAEVHLAIEKLHSDRIGHGYRVLEDESIYEIAKTKGIHFEVCPISSFSTASVTEDWHKHPAKRFFHDGVNFGLNTDDPGVFQSTLMDEYDIATRYWGMTTKDLHTLNINAAKSCFLDGAEKYELVQNLEKEYQNFNTE